MRMTSVLRKLLGIKHLVAVGAKVDNGNLVVEVHPSWRVPHCSRCQRRVWAVYDHQGTRRWRHLDFGAFQVFMEFRPCRVNCGRCGIVVEQVPWCDDPRSRFTTDFENRVAYLAQRVDKSPSSS